MAQAAGQQIARLPDKPVEVSRTVNTYLQYLRQLREQLYHAYSARTLDQAVVGVLWASYGANLTCPV